MKIGITVKLFLAFLATSIVIALAMAVATRVSVDTGFRGYIADREGRRLDSLAQVLARAYAEHGSWDFLRGNDLLWQNYNRAVLRDRGAGPRPSGGPPPAFGPRRAPGPPPDSAPHGGDEPPPDDGGDGRDRPAPPSILLDLQQRPVAGHASMSLDGTQHPIIVAGREVGRLLGPSGPPLLEGADLHFLEGQERIIWMVGLLAVLVAAIVAMAVARGLLAPVKRLAVATHALVGGDYTVRVAPTTRDELAQLVGDFNRLAESLENTDQLRRNFLADISHELRTPVAVLQGELEALEDGIRPLTPEAIRSLRAEIANLNKLIGDLYDLSLSDVGGLAYRTQDVDFGEAVAAALAAFSERLATQRIAVEWALPGDVPLLVRGDPDRLRQLLYNLIENSVRYTDAGGRIRVVLRLAGKELHLDIEDSAPGVPAEMLPRIFERLFRVESSRNRASGGAGLGLALCRSIVAAHGGTIEARASRLGGLWIRVVLPLAGT